MSPNNVDQAGSLTQNAYVFGYMQPLGMWLIHFPSFRLKKMNRSTDNEGRLSSVAVHW